MFGLFKKKPVLPIVIDKVWKREAEKNIGMVNDITKFMSQGQSVLLFYFFEQTREELKAVLAERKVEFSEDINATGQLFLIPADHIDQSSAFANVMTEKFRKDVVKLFFAEHYPTKTLENVLSSTLKDMSEENITLTFFISLESELMKVFGSERIMKIMESPMMGLKEGEFIEHKMVSTSITRAQQKIEQNLSGEIKAKSQKEWFEVNGVSARG